MKSLKRKLQESEAEVREPDRLLTPEQRERQRQAGALVREWAKEEDDGLWSLVEEEFEERRRERFREALADAADALGRDRETLDFAEEFLPLDNEALGLAEDSAPQRHARSGRGARE